MFTRRNYVEKLVQQALVKPSGTRTTTAPRSGDFVRIRPKHVMTHDNTAAVLDKFESLQRQTEGTASTIGIVSRDQPVFALDHNVQDVSDANLAKYKRIEAFAKSKGVDFYKAGRGIGHQILCEEGYAWPGTVVVASDSHSNMYGGLGCLGTPVVRTDAAALWATGETWWQIPPVTKVMLENKLNSNATGKDVIIALCGAFNQDQVLNHAVEFQFADDAARDSLTVDDRLTIANMTTEWGALAGVFEPDERVVEWLTNQYTSRYKGAPRPHPRLNEAALDALAASIAKSSSPLKADDEAPYRRVLELDMAALEPHVAGPNDVKVATPVREVEQERVRIDKAYIVSCVNSRASDLAAAARVFRESDAKKVADGVEMYVAAASSVVEEESRQRGDWQVLLDAGAKPLPAGCGPCIGLGAGLLEDGQVGISATNRNYRGRMGSPRADVYLASPAVVAASAMEGYICRAVVEETDSIGQVSATTGSAGNEQTPPAEDDDGGSGTAATVTLMEGFPAQIKGPMTMCLTNNINTDGIYPGKYTYDESISPTKQAQVAMENYCDRFQQVAQSGDVLVVGDNFGTGSSREQAATALLHFGIQVVVGASFSATYKRNAFNNGLIVIECPSLVDVVREWHRTQGNTSQEGWDVLIRPEELTVNIRFDQAMLEVYDHARGGDTRPVHRLPFQPLGDVVQRLVANGGLANVILSDLENERGD